MGSVNEENLGGLQPTHLYIETWCTLNFSEAKHTDLSSDDCKGMHEMHVKTFSWQILVENHGLHVGICELTKEATRIYVGIFNATWKGVLYC